LLLVCVILVSLFVVLVLLLLVLVFPRFVPLVLLCVFGVVVCVGVGGCDIEMHGVCTGVDVNVFDGVDVTGVGVVDGVDVVDVVEVVGLCVGVCVGVHVVANIQTDCLRRDRLDMRWHILIVCVCVVHCICCGALVCVITGAVSGGVGVVFVLWWCWCCCGQWCRVYCWC